MRRIDREQSVPFDGCDEEPTGKFSNILRRQGLFSPSTPGGSAFTPMGSSRSRLQ